MLEIADIVIVGGGIVGTLLAYELSLRSVRVVLLEANALASGTSGSAFAWINASSKDDDEVYHRFNAEALGRWRTLRERDSKLPGIYGGGALSWTQNDPIRRDALRKKANRLASWGYPVVSVNGLEISALEPALDAGQKPETEGIFFPSELWIETGRVIRYLAEQARKRAAEICEDTPFLGITLDSAGRVSQVRTAKGNISTRNLILAAGNATPSLLDFLPPLSVQIKQRVPLVFAPGILLELSPSEHLPKIDRVLCPDSEMGLRLRSTPNGGLLLGADSLDARLKSEPVAAVLGDAEEILLSHAARYFPTLEDVDLRGKGTVRLCERVMPADAMPIVGRLPDVEGITVAVTHSGITLAPLIAALLAEEMLTSKLPAALRPYAPSRFSR